MIPPHPRLFYRRTKIHHYPPPPATTTTLIWAQWSSRDHTLKWDGRCQSLPQGSHIQPLSGLVLTAPVGKESMTGISLAGESHASRQTSSWHTEKSGRNSLRWVWVASQWVKRELKTTVKGICCSKHQQCYVVCGTHKQNSCGQYELTLYGKWRVFKIPSMPKRNKNNSWMRRTVMQKRGIVE